MKISTVLDHIDGGHMAPPEFQRGYVLNCDQVRWLFDSLYHRHPVGGLPRGQIAFDYADPATGAQKALFDLAWSDELQQGLSAPVAVLLNETADVPALASGAGFRCFTSLADFRTYIETEVLHLEAA